jgi:cytochrome b561
MTFRLRMPGWRKRSASNRLTPTEYSRTAIFIHWLTAGAIALVVALGMRMTETGGAERGRAQTLHMSIGISILLLTVLRLVLRAIHRPSLAPTLIGWQRRAADATHIGFYALLIAVPSIGWLFVATSSSGSAAPLLGFLPWPGGLAGNRSVAELAEVAHRALAYGLCALLFLHAAAAIRHHLENADFGLVRILPGARRLLGWRTALVVGGLVVLFVIGKGSADSVLPQALRLVDGNADRQAKAPIDPRKARVFASVMQPILEQKCVDCHGRRSQKGGLRLDSFAALARGGESGKVIVPGKAEESDLVRRILMPPEHEDAMPPTGRPALTAAEGQLLLWWIDGGAAEAVTIRAAGPPPLVQGILQSLGVSSESPVLTRKVATPDPHALAKLRESFRVQLLFSGSGLLEVQRSFDRDAEQPLPLDDLAAVAEQLVWLDLSGARVPAKQLTVLARLRNLQRLNLAGSRATDETVHAIRDLPYLETLNLYGTDVTDAALDSIARMPSLASVYLGGTAVSAAAIERFRASHPQLQINWVATATLKRGTT